MEGITEHKERKQKKSRRYWFVVAVLVFVLFVAAMVGECFYLTRKNKTNPKETTSAPTTSSSATQFDSKDRAIEPTITDKANTSSATQGNSSSPTLVAPAESAEAYYAQGLSYSAQKNYTKAIEYFDKAIALNPNNPTYYSAKAEAQVSNGDKQGAIATVQAGLVANPNDTTLQNKLDILQTVVQ